MASEPSGFCSLAKEPNEVQVETVPDGTQRQIATAYQVEKGLKLWQGTAIEDKEKARYPKCPREGERFREAYFLSEFKITSLVKVFLQNQNQ